VRSRIKRLWQGRTILRGALRWKGKCALLAAGAYRQQARYGQQAQAYNPEEIQHSKILLAMTDSDYLQHAEALLSAVEASCDRINDTSDADVDNQRTGGMITLTFANRSQIVINLQKPLQEVWLATKAGGFHYKFDSAWYSTREGTEFFSDLNEHASAQSGSALVFKA
jgi:CyaY protein